MAEKRELSRVQRMPVGASATSHEQNLAVLAISSAHGCWQRNPDASRVYKVLKKFFEKDGLISET